MSDPSSFGKFGWGLSLRDIPPTASRSYRVTYFEPTSGTRTTTAKNGIALNSIITSMDERGLMYRID